VLEHNTALVISWSPRWKSYLYDVVTSVTVKKGGRWRTFEDGWYDGMEYLDVFPTGIFNQGWDRPEPWPNPNPPQCQPWCAPERYRACLYQEAGGAWRQFSLNRLVARWCNRLSLGGEGLFAFANEQAGNPVVQLVGNTLHKSQVSLCHMMYDVHFFLPSCTWASKGRHSARYRLFAVDTKTAREWQKHAKGIEPNNYDRWRLALPVYAPPGEVSTFDRVIRPDRYDDAYHWLPTDAAGWEAYEIPIDRSGVKFAHSPCEGRDGKGAAMVWSGQGGRHGWVSYQHPAQVLPNRRYCLSAWVRTLDLVGLGATIGITANMPIGGRRYPDHSYILLSPRRIKGITDWTKLTFDLPCFGDNSGTSSDGMFYRHNVVRLWLLQEGRGTTWFDDVLLEPIDGCSKEHR